MSLISFLIIQLPPDDYLTSMIATMSDSGQAVDPAQIERLKQIYGFDDPFYVQYLKWMWGIISRGDFGWSFEWNQPVSGLIWARMGSTLVISLQVLARRVLPTWEARLCAAADRSGLRLRIPAADLIGRR